MDKAIQPGARIGSYEVIDRLGAGGMGEVYRARDTRLGRTVALKVLRTGADPELLHRLDREARAASALNHPNIVHIYDVGEAAGQEGAHFVVMEHVEGENLRRRLSHGPLPMPELLDLGAQLVDGLACAHRAGIVHRDLKPENLMVTPDGVLKVLDFGLAKQLVAPLADVDGETISRHGTQAGTLLGTLEYMSPEQASGRPVDRRTDQFSLGLILYEMAGGRPVFRRDTPAQVLAAVIERDPEPLRTVRADAPAALETLVMRCLQKDPGRRFETTDEVAAELFALAGRSRPGGVSRAGVPVARSVEVVVASPAPAAPEPTRYHVDNGGRVKTYEADDLAKRIRRGRLSGLEMVRAEGQDQWQPLHQSAVYRREVPMAGDPHEVARSRAVRGLVGHFSGFFITGVVMYATQGHLPFWMAIWGAVLAMQVLKTGTRIWPMFPRPGSGGAAGLPAPAAEPARLPAKAAASIAPAPPGVPAAVADEAARVRALLKQTGGKDTDRLIADVDSVVEQTGRLCAQMADLEEQTTEKEREALARAIADARSGLDHADTDHDRRLFERQLQVLTGREETIGKALRLLQRLRVRRDLAEHQLKQLRLDLSRSAAGGLDAPELSSRLRFIRDEVDAREEVEALRAGPR